MNGRPDAPQFRRSTIWRMNFRNLPESRERNVLSNPFLQNNFFFFYRKVINNSRNVLITI